LLLRHAKRGRGHTQPRIGILLRCNQFGVLRRGIRLSPLLSRHLTAQCVAPDHSAKPKSIATAIAASSAPEYVLGVS